MVAKKITSLQHPLVKHWLLLRTDRSYREENQRLLIMGRKMVEEQKIQTLITSDPKNPLPAKETFLVTEQILKKITGLSQPDGFAAEVAKPPFRKMDGKKYLLILDRISDPGNLGTLIRAALALNWEGVIVTPNTVDLFNDKAIRAGKGAHFHIPLALMNEDEIQKLPLQFYTADLEGMPVDQCAFTPGIGLILSSESRGPQKWAKNQKKITIPMRKEIESLNVALSGAILLYLMRI